MIDTVKQLRHLAAAAAILLGVAACGSAEEALGQNPDPSAESSSAPSPTKTTPTKPEPVPVSMSTACQLLSFDNVLWRAQDQIDLLVKHPDGSRSDPSKVQHAADTLHDVAVRAPSQLAVQLEAMATPLEQWADILRTGVNSNLDLQGYRAGGVEVIRLCGADAL